jgi:hypothetical protein
MKTNDKRLCDIVRLKLSCGSGVLPSSPRSRWLAPAGLEGQGRRGQGRREQRFRLLFFGGMAGTQIEGFGLAVMGLLNILDIRAIYNIMIIMIEIVY